MYIDTWTDKTGAERRTTVIETTDDLTEEVLDLIRGAVDGWYSEGRIDWEDVWDRVEGYMLADGTELSMGPEQDSPAMRKAQRTINTERRQG